MELQKFSKKQLSTQDLAAIKGGRRVPPPPQWDPWEDDPIDL